MRWGSACVCMLCAALPAGWVAHRIRDSALTYFRSYMETATPVRFPSVPPRFLTAACPGHHTDTAFAVVTVYEGQHQRLRPRQQQMICRLARSATHFTNADLFLLTAEASSDALKCGWKQCLFERLPNTTAWMNAMARLYTRILFLNLTLALPYRQFAPMLTGGVVKTPAIMLLPPDLDPASWWSCLRYRAADVCLFWSWV